MGQGAGASLLYFENGYKACADNELTVDKFRALTRDWVMQDLGGF